jgi:vancomycin resistance protein YoaR
MKEGKGRALLKAGGITAAIIGAAAGAISISSARYDHTIQPVEFTLFSVVGRTRSEVRADLEDWWSTESQKDFSLTSPLLNRQLDAPTLASLGVSLNYVETLDQLPYEGLIPALWRQTRFESDDSSVDVVLPVFDFSGVDMDALQAFIVEATPESSPAGIAYTEGQIILSLERTGLTLDEDQLIKNLTDSILTSQPAELPIIEAEKTIEDDVLKKIDSVIGEFTTKFNHRQWSRSKNIELASLKFEGKILMPGESIAFNPTVGKRTLAAGFKEAGVYIAGRHETEVGGGICQVSTTLYNAALLAEMGIEQRYCHSLAVPYVPLGQDATVSWKGPDLQIKNTLPYPIGITTEYQKGSLTFRILGSKRPEGREVKIERTYIRRIEHETEYVHDPELAYGEEIEVDKGGNGHRLYTYRVVTENGVEIIREDLGLSLYKGGPKIIGRNELAIPPLDDDRIPFRY